ncbi:unnamed protein product [Cyclocybe aegerita]|uniref:Uncharacterized protein n=1 Tax=Cyclocybe aegerita TaxID=1973307 RepID=A0A8S0WTL2_CYCAE|nr:unnamed protein product [Cyclocybe aegerita]
MSNTDSSDQPNACQRLSFPAQAPIRSRTLDVTGITLAPCVCQQRQAAAHRVAHATNTRLLQGQQIYRLALEVGRRYLATLEGASHGQITQDLEMLREHLQALEVLINHISDTTPP